MQYMKPRVIVRTFKFKTTDIQKTIYFFQLYIPNKIMNTTSFDWVNCGDNDDSCIFK